MIGTISPDYFITSIQKAYRKELHQNKTEQYIEMCPDMMNLVNGSNRVSKGKRSQSCLITV